MSATDGCNFVPGQMMGTESMLQVMWCGHTSDLVSGEWIQVGRDIHGEATRDLSSGLTLRSHVFSRIAIGAHF